MAVAYTDNLCFDVYLHVSGILEFFCFFLTISIQIPILLPTEALQNSSFVHKNVSISAKAPYVGR